MSSLPDKNSEQEIKSLLTELGFNDRNQDDIGTIAERIEYLERKQRWLIERESYQAAGVCAILLEELPYWRDKYEP